MWELKWNKVCERSFERFLEKKSIKSDNWLGRESKGLEKNKARVTVVLSLSLEKQDTIHWPRISKGECFGNFREKIFSSVLREW